MYVSLVMNAESHNVVTDISTNILTGLLEIWPEKVDVAFMPEYLLDDYNSNQSSTKPHLWGQGYNVIRTIPRKFRNSVVSQEQMLENERNGVYSLIVYGSIKRSSVMLGNFTTTPRHRKWFFYGEDFPTAHAAKWCVEYHHVNPCFHLMMRAIGWLKEYYLNESDF